jgi:uncharacterized protein (DUF736 family)
MEQKMSDYDNTNSGALFKNDKGDNPKRPDYTGSINVEGKDFWISSWIKTSQKGTKFMSLSVQAKEEQAQPDADVEFDDDMPF